MFNDAKINVIEMPRDLIVAANVDKSGIIHTLEEAFHLFYKMFCSSTSFKISNGAFKRSSAEITTFGGEPNVFRT